MGHENLSGEQSRRKVNGKKKKQIDEHSIFRRISGFKSAAIVTLHSARRDILPSVLRSFGVYHFRLCNNRRTRSGRFNYRRLSAHL